jgi:hypothetical protein
VAVVGSCNWLYSSFESTEISAVLQDPSVVAEVATAMQRMSGGTGLANSIANELAIVAAAADELAREVQANGVVLLRVKKTNSPRKICYLER